MMKFTVNFIQDQIYRDNENNAGEPLKERIGIAVIRNRWIRRSSRFYDYDSQK